MKIIILCGLPGSGKTFFSKKYEKAKIYDFDKLVIENHLSVEKVMKMMKQENSIGSVIADGLFLTQKDYELFATYFSNEALEFHYWNENRKQCLKNLENRKEKKASITAKYAILEKPDMVKLSKIHDGCTIVEHEVFKGEW